MIRRILLGLGSTPSSHALVKRGVELARLHDAKIIAVTLTDVEYWKHTFSSFMTTGEAVRLLDARPWVSASQRMQAVVSEFCRACDKAAVGYEVKPNTGKPLEHLGAQWRYCDLVIVGLRALLDTRFGLDTERAIAHMVRQGIRPLLLEAEEYRPIRRVLIAYSGSIESAKAMKRFVQMRLWPDAQSRLVCFGKPGPSRQLLDEAADYCASHGFQVASEVVDGHADQALLPYARQAGADLIIAGDGFRHSAIRDVLGDTMSRLIKDTDRSLFVSH